MAVTLEQIANKLNAELRGDPACVIDGVAALGSATSGKITYCESSKYKNQLAATKASAVLITADLKENYHGNALLVANPKLTFIQLIELFHPPQIPTPGVHATAIIGKECQIDATASVGPYVVLGKGVKLGKSVVIAEGCSIGDNVHIDDHTILYPQVTVYSHTRIGQHGIIHSGAVLGADGFGFVPTAEYRWAKIPHIGGLLIGNHCEIGANTTIDRGALEDTVINDGVKIDNLCMIAHNVQIGEHTVIAGCVAVGGSTSIGKHCVIGGATAIADHLIIADRVILAGGTTVTGSLTKSDTFASGTSVQPHREWRRSVACFRQLDKMLERIRKLEKGEPHEH